MSEYRCDLNVRWFTCKHAEWSAQRVAGKLDERQAQVADQQTADVIDLALPVEHVVRAGQHAAGHQGDGQEENGQQQAERVQREPYVVAVALGHVVPGRAREHRPQPRFRFLEHALQTVIARLKHNGGARGGARGAQRPADRPLLFRDRPMGLVDAAGHHVLVVVTPRETGCEIGRQIGRVVRRGPRLARRLCLAV